MAAESTKVRRLSGVKGAAVRHGTSADVEVAERDLVAARIEAYIERIVAVAPPLSPEQVGRIVGALHPAVSP